MCFLSFLLFFAAAVVAIGAVVRYGISGTVSCGYASDPANCRTLLPWELEARDFLLMVLLPLGGVQLLGLLGWLLESPPPPPPPPPH